MQTHDCQTPYTQHLAAVQVGSGTSMSLKTKTKTKIRMGIQVKLLFRVQLQGGG